jgi:hypothetical protein
LIFVALTMPPVESNVAPVPTCIVAVVLVPLVIAEKAEPPPLTPQAPPTSTIVHEPLTEVGCPQSPLTKPGASGIRSVSAPFTHAWKFLLVESYPTSPFAADAYPAVTGSLNCEVPEKSFVVVPEKVFDAASPAAPKVW